jgi:zinc/manganese transport system substrate-binding protein
MWMSKVLAVIATFAFIIASLSGCQASTSGNGKKTIVVTYSVLGSVVKDLVGDKANVIVSMPNGLDPHEWEPSAKDIEQINKADFVIENGLGLESGLEKTLQTAKDRGVRFFTASDHIDVRHVGPGEGIPSGDPDQAIGAPDPHLWMDPITIKAVVDALAVALQSELGIDVTGQAQSLDLRLENLTSEVAAEVATVPQADRKLVTGHESMGYFAQRYGLKLVGVIIPSLSSQAAVSAADLAALKNIIVENQVKAIFTELGTPSSVGKAIGDETRVKVIELTTHALPSDGSYFTFMRDLVKVVVDGLK